LFVGWGFAPDPLGELTSLPQTPSWFRGGAHGKRAGGRGGEKNGGEGREGKGWEERGGHPGMPKSRLQSWQAYDLAKIFGYVNADMRSLFAVFTCLLDITFSILCTKFCISNLIL